MNRYFYFSFVLVSMINLMLFVPYILLQQRFTGAVPSILLAVVIGSALAFGYTHAMSKFPGKGLPEILHMHYPRWLTVPTLLFFASMWVMASGIALSAFATLINRFINPDTEATTVAILLIIACVYGASRSTLTVLFTIEMTLLLNAPIIVFILGKSLRNPFLNWDAIHTVANHVATLPTLDGVAAATYIFTGYISLSIFNRVFPPNFSFRYRWSIPFMGLTVLLLSFFIPIGFHGTEGVSNYLYVWSVTADSMLMQYGFAERVLFLFLILYLNLTLTYTVSGWHQAMEFVKSCFPSYKPNIDETKLPNRNWLLCSIFGALTLLYLMYFNEKEQFMLSHGWLVVRMFTELLIVGWLLLLARKAIAGKQKTERTVMK